MTTRINLEGIIPMLSSKSDRLMQNLTINQKANTERLDSMLTRD